MSLSLESSKQVIAEVITRPLRFGYVVNRAVEYKILREVYEYNSSLWGGLYSVFIPTDGQSIRSDWLRTLVLHSPDIIFIVGELDEIASQEIYDLVLPMQMQLWSNLEARHANSLTMEFILREFASKNLRLSSDDAGFRYFMVDGEYSSLIETKTGIWSAESWYLQFAEHELAITTFTCFPENLAGYLELVDKLNTFSSPLVLTGEHLRASYGGFDITRDRVIFTDGMYDDLFIYFSAQGSFNPASTILIPISLLTDTADYIKLATWLAEQFSENTFEIVSYSLTMEDLIKIRNQLKSYLPQRFSLSGQEGWAIDIARCNLNFAFPYVTHLQESQQITVRDGKFAFSIAKPTFFETFSSHRTINIPWISDIDLSPKFGNKSGFAPSRFPDLNFLLSRLPSRQWLKSGISIRNSRGKLTVNSTLKNNLPHIQLPSDLALIKSLCEGAGYKYNEKGRSYYGGLMTLLGDLQKASFLRKGLIRQLLRLPDLIKGKALTIEKMLSELKIGKKDIEKWISFLSGNSILFRGYNLKCNICGLETWYELSRVNEFIRCEGCRTSFQIPTELKFAYRLNQLFMAEQSQGALTVLLALLLLDASIINDLIWQADVKLEKANQEIEIDILAMCDGCLVVIECKDSFMRPRKKRQSQKSWEKQRSEDIDKLKKQLEREIALAEDLRAHLFLFATLESQLPEEIFTFIAEQDKVHKQMGIYLISDELTTGKLKSPNEIDKNLNKQILIRSLGDKYILPAYYVSVDCSNKDQDGYRSFKIVQPSST